MESSHELQESHQGENITPVEAEPSVAQPTYRLISAGFAFFVAGVNDGSLGALMPYVLQSYRIGTNVVAAVLVASMAVRDRRES